jgi:hypothetical protein
MNLKTKIIAVLSAIIVLLGGYTATQFGGQTGATIDLLGTKSTSTFVGATTTRVLYFSQETDHLDLNIRASSTGGTVLSVVPYFSNDAGCNSSTNATVNWFPESGLGVSGATVSVSAPLVYAFTMTTSTANNFNLGWNNLAAQCMRFDVYTSAMNTVSTTVWMEAVNKSN